VLRHQRAGELLVPLDDQSYDPEFWPKAGGYPLIPFHNRVRDGLFIWNGREIRLPLHPSEPNALHGFSSRRSWIGQSLDDAGARMELDHEGDAYWPWALHASQTVSLDENSMSLTLSVTNRDNETMPAGLGWHPFMPSPKAISHDAQIEWPIEPDYFPSSASHPVSEATDRSPTRYLSTWSKLDVILANGCSVAIRCDRIFSHLVIHESPAGYACIEPATHLANALSAPPSDPSDRMYPLAPGETLSGTIVLDVKA